MEHIDFDIEEIVYILRQRILALLEDCQVDLDLAQAVAGKGVSANRLLSDPFDSRSPM